MDYNEEEINEETEDEEEDDRNEPTRQFEKIFDEYHSPDKKDRLRILTQREKRLKMRKRDWGLS